MNRIQQVTEVLTGLASAYGTPLYVYRLPAVAQAHAALRAALPDQSKLYYSVKANPHPELISSLATLGCGAEISSVGEMHATLAAAGVDPAQCIYTGPGKTNREIVEALDRGVRRFSVESATELDRLEVLAAASGSKVDCLLRVNAMHAAASGLRMTGRPSQFGIELDWLRTHGEICRHWGAARVVGLHQYPVSNTTSLRALLDAVAAGVHAAVELRDQHGLALTELDLGGGFASPYAVPGDPPEYGASLRDGITTMLDEHLPRWRGGEPEVSFESGRRLVGPAGDLVCAVTEVKRSADRTFAILDAGIHHVGGLSGTGRLLPAAVRPELLGTGNGPDRVMDLAGPLCTPADMLAIGVTMPEPCPGDLLRVPNVGAYGLTASLLAFLSRPTPVEVVVDGVDVVSVSSLRIARVDVPAAARAPR